MNNNETKRQSAYKSDTNTKRPENSIENISSVKTLNKRERQ